MVGNAAGWLEGKPGPLDLYNTVFGLFPVVELALIRHLDRVAASALAGFRPLLVGDEASYLDLERRLTTAPRGPTAAYTAAWVVGGLLGVASDPGAHRVDGVGPLTAAVVVGVEVMINALLGVLILKAGRHIRDVARIHREAPRIDLLNPAPLYAFSRLTSQTALGLLFLVAILVLSLARAYFTDALAPTRVFFVFTMAGLVVAAMAIFVLPLYDMHRRIVVEEERLQAASGQGLKTLLGELDHDIRTLELARADGLNKLLGSALSEREILSRLPTWPWQAATLRGFMTALLVPVLVYLLARAAERVVL